MKSLLILIALLPLCVWGASSREERQNKKFEISVSSGFDYIDYTYGVTLSKFIDADNVISLKGGFNNEGDDEQTHAAFQYKHFFGNSFYLAPEVYYFHFFEKNPNHDNIFDLSVDRISSLGLGVRIGNQWSWKNFTLGVDWIGIGKHLITWSKDQDDLDLGYSATLLNFYVGWSF